MTRVRDLGPSVPIEAALGEAGVVVEGELMAGQSGRGKGALGKAGLSQGWATRGRTMACSVDDEASLSSKFSP